MNRLFWTFFSLILAFVIPARADYHLKIVEQTDSSTKSLWWGNHKDKDSKVDEVWFSSDRMVHQTRNQTVITDLAKKKEYILLPLKKKYIETSIPLDLQMILPQKMADALLSSNKKLVASIEASKDKVKVTVTPTERKRTITGLACQEYQVTTIDSSEKPTTTKVDTYWVTQDLNLDWPKFFELNQAAWGSALTNQALITEIPGFKGVIVASEWTMEYKFLGKNKIVIKKEAVQFEETPIPEELMAIPAGYQKVERFTIEDFTENK